MQYNYKLFTRVEAKFTFIDSLGVHFHERIFFSVLFILVGNHLRFLLFGTLYNKDCFNIYSISMD